MPVTGARLLRRRLRHGRRCRREQVGLDGCECQGGKKDRGGEEAAAHRPGFLCQARLAPVRPATSSTRKMTRKMKKSVLAMAMEVPAMPVKPSTPAIRPITRKINAHFSTAHSVFRNPADRKLENGCGSSRAILS